MNFYLATSNRHKADELERLLAERGLERVSVRTAADAGGMPWVDEDSNTFEGNARLKARAFKQRAGDRAWVLADDSGLEVDALGGAPGVYSARYAGAEATDAENNARLLGALEGKPVCDRSARFRCCLVLIAPDGTEESFEGVCEGRIAMEPSGKHGFGYDPVFVPAGYARSFGELGESVKSRISHRARALEKLGARLAEIGD